MTGSSFRGLCRSCYSGARGGPADEDITREPPGPTGREAAYAAACSCRLIQLVIGFIANLALLETIGIITLVIGAVLWNLGSMGRQVGARAAGDRVGLVGGGGVNV